MILFKQNRNNNHLVLKFIIMDFFTYPHKRANFIT